MRDINIGLLGIGTVGTGVVRLLAENHPRIRARLGAGVVLRRALCKDLEKERAGIDPSILTTRPEDIIDDPEIDVVVELIGGGSEVLEFLKRAIHNGKHIVTANKALLAAHGAELTQLANKNGVDLFYEASVGGGIPIIRAIREALAADHIHALYGIINGTTNYILTRMESEGRDFESVLDEAVREGFAEADPSLDVDGLDAKQKLVILGALAFGRDIPESKVFCEGIRHVTALDITVARDFGYVVKLLAVAREDEGVVELRVHPALVPSDSLLAHVQGVYNAVLLDSRASGFQLFYGRGAGMMPTASAVVSDVIEVCRDILQQRHGRIPTFGQKQQRELSFRPMNDVRSHCYMRFTAVDQPGVLGQIASILGQHGISIAEMKQLGEVTGSEVGSDGVPIDGVPIIILTHECREGDIHDALDQINKLSITVAPPRLIRVVDPAMDR